MLGAGEPLIGGEPIPFHSFGIVFGHAPAVGVHEPKVVLRLGRTLLGSLAVPAHRFGIVLRNAPSIGVHTPEVVLPSP